MTTPNEVTDGLLRPAVDFDTWPKNPRSLYDPNLSTQTAGNAQPVQPAAYKITDNDIKACFKFHLGWNHSQADKTSYRAVLETYESRRSNVAQAQGQFKRGDLVRKRKGSERGGRIVGFYSVELIYPAAALELIPPAPAQGAKA